MSKRVEIKYSYAEVAEIAGVSVKAVKLWFKRKGWEIGNMEQVVRYCASMLMRRGK